MTMLKIKRNRAITWVLAALLFGSVASLPVTADDDGDEYREKGGGNATSAAMPPSWKTECAECHLAYPAKLLPASGWREIMGNLDQHFGTDASLDAATIAEILPFLEQNAGSERKYAAAEGKSALRITETRWFVHEHYDELSPAVWKRVSSPANCAACHTTAEQGNYDEDFIKIPR
ncbi:MAG: diheme cytochrome c [Candidatus Thiothrix sulfatifontis]|nr:MAG: diheme cytochrome c [Candidatus Thiothrix sulfatifontis]